MARNTETRYIGGQEILVSGRTVRAPLHMLLRLQDALWLSSKHQGAWRVHGSAVEPWHELEFRSMRAATDAWMMIVARYPGAMTVAEYMRRERGAQYRCDLP